MEKYLSMTILFATYHVQERKKSFMNEEAHLLKHLTVKRSDLNIIKRSGWKRRNKQSNENHAIFMRFLITAKKNGKNFAPEKTETKVATVINY